MINLPPLATWEQTTLAIEQHLQQSNGQGQVDGLARILLGAFPDVLLCACSLGCSRNRQVMVLDARGQKRLDLSQQLSGSSGSDPATGWTKCLTHLGTVVVVGDECALLAVVLDPSASAEKISLTRLLLTFLVRSCALVVLRDRVRALHEEVAALEPLAHVGELAGVVAHEITDFLNVLLLQVAVIEANATDRPLDDLATIHRRGNQASALLGRFQEHRRITPSVTPVDLTEIVKKVTNRLEMELPEFLPVLMAHRESPSPTSLSNGVTLLQECQATETFVRGHTADVQRLVRYLVSNAIRAAGQSNAQVTVTLEKGMNGPRLRVETSKPCQWPNQTSMLFDRASQSLEGIETLELAACRSLARRLRCNLTAENREEGGIRLVAEFPSATHS